MRCLFYMTKLRRRNRMSIYVDGRLGRLCTEARSKGGVAQRSGKAAKKAAEGEGYGSGKAYGNSTAYLAFAGVQTGLAGLMAALPESAHELLFGVAGGPYTAPLFRILACGLLAASTSCLVQAAASRAGMLDEDVHRRLNASLSFLAASFLFIPAISFVPNPSLYPEPPLQPAAAAAIILFSSALWWLAGRNYAKYSSEGANPIKILGSYARDLSQLVKTDGLNSGIYAALTVGFIIAGLGYEFAPVQSLDAILGTLAGKGTQTVLLWQLTGGAVATAVAPLAYTAWEAAMQNNFSLPNKRTLIAGLGVSSALHTIILALLLNTELSGPLLFPTGFAWGTAAVASVLIAIKPSEDDEKNKIFKDL
eukprot:jgi/Astpho2/1843/Aster-00371